MPDPLPGPRRPHSAGPPRDQDQHAMELALSVLRAQAYRGGSDIAASAERGEAIDALSLALGHTQLIGDQPEPFRLGEPGELPDPVLLIDALRSAHGERLERLEQMIYGDPPGRVSVMRQLEAIATTLGVLASRLPDTDPPPL